MHKSIRGIYILTPEFAVPPKSGGHQRMMYAVSLLSMFRKITLITYSSSLKKISSEFMSKYFVDVISIPENCKYQIDASGNAFVNILKDIIDARPRQMRYLDSLDFYNLIEGVVQDPHAAVWSDSLWMTYMLTRIDGWQCRLVSDWDDIESVVGLQRLRQISTKTSIVSVLMQSANYLKIKCIEKKLAPLCDFVVVAAEQHSQMLRHKYEVTTMCFPNVVAKMFSEYPLDISKKKRILFPGTLSFMPNVDAVEWFLNNIWPIVKQKVVDAEFIVAGRAPSREVKDMCDIAGVKLIDSPPDMMSVLMSAILIVVPIRYGSGTRIKILEALNCGKAVVSTSLGAEGLDLCDEEHLLLADNPQEFADQSCRLLQDSSLRRKLSQAGWRKVQSHYIVDAQEPIIRRMIHELERKGNVEND